LALADLLVEWFGDRLRILDSMFILSVPTMAGGVARIGMFIFVCREWAY